LPYTATNRITVFKAARRRAAPVGREEMDVMGRRERLDMEAIEEIRDVLE
jgi:hypothetical protein